jgi:ubiquinone biosynthesis monooxygenase Coq7
MNNSVRLSSLDRLIVGTDRVLRTLYGAPLGSGRPSPAEQQGTIAPVLPEAERQRSGKLMRVNHAGEVSAQALYHGQSLVARKPRIATHLRKAGEEENDHLIWCKARLAALETPPSRLNPLWYAGSFAIGAFAGALGDRLSLGFLEETENQVVEHLNTHLERLPEEDAASRHVLQQMRTDEAQHGQGARAAGGKRPPAPVRLIMKAISKVMTTTAYWL